MKRTFTLLLACFLWGLGGLYAQKTLIGVNTGNPNSMQPYYGNITQYDINGENPVIVHEFDNINGASPIGRLFLASNGKLYGTTSGGGNQGPEGSLVSGGVLFEYDLILNKYTNLYNFDIDFSRSPQIGVIEPVTGQLYGATLNRIFKYDIAAQNITFSNQVPYNNIYADLTKASNGFIYGTSYAGNCLNTGSNEPFQGTIFRYNLATNILTNVFTFSCSGANLYGSFPNSKLIEISPGKLLGTTSNGGIHTSPVAGYNGGTLFEFNTNTTVFTKKIDFDYYVNGIQPLNLVDNGNGKVYGLCSTGGAPQMCNPTANFGTLYEYTPETNIIEVKQNFAYCGNNISAPTSLIKTSLGAFIGTIPNGGLFRWDADTNTITMPNYTSSNSNLYNTSNLIEICRKPSYHFFDVDTFDACIGGNFSYDIQNTNAITYQWQKNNIDVSGQTGGILNLNNLTSNDAGDYTCIMTNECGTTTSMVLHLTVNCLGVNQIALLEKAIKLYPNPTKSALNIHFPENINVIVDSFKIANALGQIVLEQKTATISTIDVNDLQTGLYFISLNTNYGTWNGRFIKD